MCACEFPGHLRSSDPSPRTAGPVRTQDLCTHMVRDANVGHQLAGGNSSWCPELKSRTTHTVRSTHRAPRAAWGCAAGVPRLLWACRQQSTAPPEAACRSETGAALSAEAWPFCPSARPGTSASQEVAAVAHGGYHGAEPNRHGLSRVDLQEGCVAVWRTSISETALVGVPCGDRSTPVDCGRTNVTMSLQRTGFSTGCNCELRAMNNHLQPHLCAGQLRRDVQHKVPLLRGHGLAVRRAKLSAEPHRLKVMPSQPAEERDGGRQGRGSDRGFSVRCREDGPPARRRASAGAKPRRLPRP